MINIIRSHYTYLEFIATLNLSTYELQISAQYFPINASTHTRQEDFR